MLAKIRRLIIALGLARRHAYAAGLVAGYVAWYAAPLLGCIAFEAADGALTEAW
jgi:hypothetical protein